MANLYAIVNSLTSSNLENGPLPEAFPDYKYLTPNDVGNNQECRSTL